MIIEEPRKRPPPLTLMTTTNDSKALKQTFSPANHSTVGTSAQHVPRLFSPTNAFNMTTGLSSVNNNSKDLRNKLSL
jgi:hypothetical protein